jgi:hypothetical protein
MSKMAIAHGFEQLKVFLNEGAKFEPVTQAIRDAATVLEKGDIFLFTFSGHGSTAQTSSGEDDGQDETILLHDCILIDNYLRRVLWSKFDEGVRILGVADCCHAGSVLFAFNFGNALKSVSSFFGGLVQTVSASFAPSAVMTPLINVGTNGVDVGPRIRGFTKDVQERIISESFEINQRITHELATEGKEPEATLLTLAACGDRENALDGDDNGAFTKAMLEVLPAVLASNPPGNYDNLMTGIADNFSIKGIKKQTPTRYPKVNPDLAFLGQTPFTISAP